MGDEGEHLECFGEHFVGEHGDCEGVVVVGLVLGVKLGVGFDAG